MSIDMKIKFPAQTLENLVKFGHIFTFSIRIMSMIFMASAKTEQFRTVQMK